MAAQARIVSSIFLIMPGEPLPGECSSRCWKGCCQGFAPTVPFPRLFPSSRDRKRTRRGRVLCLYDPLRPALQGTGPPGTARPWAFYHHRPRKCVPACVAFWARERSPSYRSELRAVDLFLSPPGTAASATGTSTATASAAAYVFHNVLGEADLACVWSEDR